MKFSRITLFLALAIVLLTSGCFRVDQELWHNTDGTGKVHFDVSVDQFFLEMASGGQALPHLFQTWQGLEEGEDSNYAAITLSDAVQEEDHSYTADVELKDFSRLKELQRETLDFSVEEQKNGTLRFSQRLDFRLNAASPDEMQTVDMLVDGLGEDAYTVKLHVPRVLSADPRAVVDTKNGTVSWSVPMTELVTATEPLEIWAEYRLSRGIPWWVWVLVGVAALGGLVAWFFTWPRTMPGPELGDRPQEDAVAEDLPPAEG